MYLVEIDSRTGLVKSSPSNSGWRAIEAFRKLDDHEFTVIALTVDYLSPIRHYKEEDRFYRALEEVYGDRSKLKSSSKRIKESLLKYKELQYNSDLEFIDININIKNRLVDQLYEANKNRDEKQISNLITLINKNKETMKKFMSDFDSDEIVNSSATENGYELSRIEQDIISRKNSKFVDSSNIRNPNKLKI